ncbi:Hypothetical protein CINCED_3A002972 [Cinara cedri]|uniref:Uncharacterized protein n=1 Tax=Cinara cedri TaxID=506608 RepID=A0A5E4NKX0_9HEMI|nr:Hypothetical protein CINCED_3A002972 [Cinara cedri]
MEYHYILVNEEDDSEKADRITMSTTFFGTDDDVHLETGLSRMRAFCYTLQCYLLVTKGLFEQPKFFFDRSKTTTAEVSFTSLCLDVPEKSIHHSPPHRYV